MNCHKSLDFAPSIHVEIDGQKLDKIINKLIVIETKEARTSFLNFAHSLKVEAKKNFSFSK